MVSVVCSENTSTFTNVHVLVHYHIVEEVNLRAFSQSWWYPKIYGIGMLIVFESWPDGIHVVSQLPMILLFLLRKLVGCASSGYNGSLSLYQEVR